jgi:MFS family permease
MTNLRSRSLCVSLMVIGYPIGAILGGMVSSHLLLTHDWRAIFTFGALCTTIVMPIVLLIMPETPAYIIAKRAPDAVDRLNRSLRKLGHFAEKTLPPITERPQTNLFSLFAPALRRNTILLTSAYFAQIITFYFILKWTPKIVTDMGFHPSTAGGILVWANVGGALGGALFGLATQYFPLKKVSLCALAASAIMVTVFGQTSANLTTLALLAGLGGFCTNAAMVGLYNLAASAFPTDLRATGTGFAIGIGRGGAALGPWIVGLLFQSGLGLPVVAAIIASGSIAAFCAIAGLRLLPTSPP